MRARIASFLFVGVTLMFTTYVDSAHAQQADPVTRQAARKLADEGQKLFDQGDFKGALEKFTLADSLVSAPPLNLMAARCLSKLGRLVEASERYLDVVRVKLDPIKAPGAHKKAQVDAVKEHQELVPKIPSIEIRVDGQLGDDGKVTVDGSDLPPALIGQKRPIDPGKHEIIAKRFDTSVKREINVAERETALVTLKLPPLPVKLVPNPSGGTQRMLAWVGFGLGAGGLLAGGINGVVALSMQSSLIEKCPNKQCPPEAHGDVDTFHIETAASTVGFIVGAVGAAAGAALYFTAPPKFIPEPQKSGKDVAISAPRIWIGFMSAGLKGDF